MTQVFITRFEPQAATRSQWTAYHAFRRARAAEDNPGEPVESDADFEANVSRSWPLYQEARFHAWAGNEIVAMLGYSYRRPGTPDYQVHAKHISVWSSVLLPWRRQGIATRLLAELPSILTELDKSIVTIWTREPDGHAFLTTIGAEARHHHVENRLQLTQVDWDEMDRWQARVGPEFTWEIHRERIPFSRMEEIIPEINRLADDVPIGTLDLPPFRWEMTGMRTYYEELDRHGGTHNIILLKADGAIAALCETGFDARRPDRVFQNLTAVARPWRGRGLAKAVKAAMLKLMREQHPAASLMITGNAEANAPMLAINHKLGFEEHRSGASYQVGADAIRRYLAARNLSV
jgi:GNAT superfamily N-acetyltransferase